MLRDLDNYLPPIANYVPLGPSQQVPAGKLVQSKTRNIYGVDLGLDVLGLSVLLVSVHLFLHSCFCMGWAYMFVTNIWTFSNGDMNRYILNARSTRAVYENVPSATVVGMTHTHPLTYGPSHVARADVLASPQSPR